MSYIPPFLFWESLKDMAKRIKQLAIATLLPHLPILSSSSCKNMKLIAAIILT